MNHEELEKYFNQLYLSGVSSDYYNRSLTADERNRIEELEKLYLEQGLFPQKEVILLDEAEDYKRGVGFLPSKSTFFFPEREMEDEELLQYIDFIQKREYSLLTMNEEIENGEFVYQAPEKEKQSTTGKEILETNAVYEPTQELVLSYEGNMGIQCMTAGKDAIYLGGYNRIERMDIGSGKPQLFFDDFKEDEVLVSCLYEAEDGSIYAGISNVTDVKSVAFGKIMLYQINADGNLIRSFMVGEREQNLIDGIAEDAEGNIYVHVRMRETAAKAGVLIYDKAGTLISTVQESEYTIHEASGLGKGRDGAVYVAIQDKKNGKNGLAQIEPDTGEMCEVYEKLQSEGDNLPWDIVHAGIDTDFITWGYEGIYTYNLGDKTAIQVMSAFELPCNFEGACVSVLSDGRMIFIKSTDGKEITLKNGEQSWIKNPENTSIYYVPTVKK